MSVAPELHALLIADIGSVTTHVWLADAVDGETRLIGQAEVPSSVTLPFDDATVAIVEAARRIEEQTGRRLTDGARLITPQNAERDGVDVVIACSSAAGLMGLVIAAVAGDVSARSAERASRATYTRVLQTVTLDDAAHRETVSSADGAGLTWTERQVQALLGLRPDAVLIAGGLEDGAQDALVRLAHIIALAALDTQVDTQGQQRQSIARRPVIFAGNSQARDRVTAVLAERADLTMVDNVRPSLDVEQLDPVRREIVRLYNDRLLPGLAGMAALHRLSRTPLRAVCDAAGVMTRFVAERYQRGVLALDAGAMHTTAHLSSQGRYSPAVLGGVGTGYGMGGVLANRGIAAIHRWLPFPISERDLLHWLLNKMLRPHVPPATREELLIEHAVAREALACALDALWDQHRDAEYDLVIVGGGILRHAPSPGLAVLTVLDALQPSAAESVLALDLHLDSLGLMNACGALAFTEADAALTLFERDLMRNTPLATVVVALGDGRPGETAVEAELQVQGGATRHVRVAHGEIARLNLSPGRRGQLTLRPAGGVRIGRNAPGVEVASDVAAISGSALGIVIDARGRPLRLPEDSRARQDMLWSWLLALGVEREPLPYAPLDSAVEPPPPALLAQTGRGTEPRASRPSTTRIEEAHPVPEGVNAGDSIEQDLAKLRQTVEEPEKKRSWFRRR